MGSLDDIVVLELAFYYPGPLCGLLLSEMGAEVLKIEPPDGDPMRPVGATGGAADGPTFELLNRGKKSVVIDLKTETGRDRFLDLVARADVLLQVLRPEVMKRLGLPEDVIREACPSIVHCVMTAYGASGPYSDRAGHDINYEAISGIAGLTGGPGDRPAIPGLPVADLSGALMATISILSAVRERDLGGEGRLLDISITEAALFGNALNLLGSWLPGEEPRPGGMLLTGRFPCYNLYRSGDGKWFSVGAIEPKFWTGLCLAAGREDLMGLQYDPSGVEPTARMFASEDSGFWNAIARDHDVCLEPVLERDEVLAHPVHESRSVFSTSMEEDRYVKIPGLESGRERGSRAPALGEHTREILGRARRQDDEPL